MLSNLQLGTNIIINDVERFDASKFQYIAPQDVEILKTPDELPKDYLAEEMIKYQITNSGLYNLSPFSFNWNQFDNTYSLLSIFKRFSNQVSLSSCRVDAIARDPYMVKLIDYFGSLNITVAVEGISQGLRNFLQKSLLDKDLYRGFNEIIKSGFRTIKVYYIYCGHETDEDLAEFEDFLIKLDELRKMHNKPLLNIRTSFTPLLSTLGTPIQYHPSNLARSLKADTATLYKIKHICARHGFGVRLSTSVPASEFAHIVEFTDRRAMPLFTYGAMNGIAYFPKFVTNFYEGEEEITKKEFDKLKVADNKLAIGDKFYKVADLDKINSGKLYKHFNERQLYGEITIFDIFREAKACSGKAASDFLLSPFTGSRRERLATKKVHVTEYEGEDHIYTYRNGKKVYNFKGDVVMSEISVDVLKKYLPLATNGVTYTDIINQKDALYVFPNAHMRFHSNQHIGAHFRQYMDNQAQLFQTYCLKSMNAKCNTCGKCESTKDMKHITTGAYETGEDYFHLITDVQKDMVTNQRFLMEIDIDSGPSAAMKPIFLKYVMSRALLKACDGAFAKNLIAEKSSANTRQAYRLKQDNFKSIMGGIYIHEFQLNAGFPIDQNYLDDMMTRINQYTTPHWKVRSLKIVSHDFNLKNALDWSSITYRFDSRKVRDITVDLLNKKIKRFLDKNFNLKYKSQVASGRTTVRIEQVDFDKSKVLSMSASIGQNKYETVLKVIAKTEEAHPLIFLAGLLGDKGPKAYNSLYGTDIILEGFYKQPATAANVFNVDGGDLSNTCSCCGGIKFTNVMTGMSFGAHPREQNEFVSAKYPDGVCQSCFIEMTN